MFHFISQYYIFLIVYMNSNINIRSFRIFQTSRYQDIVKATVSGVFEDLTFKISEGLDQN